MNDNLKHMWDSVRNQELPSQKEFRPAYGEAREANKVGLKHQPDFSSKERKNVGGI